MKCRQLDRGNARSFMTSAPQVLKSQNQIECATLIGHGFRGWMTGLRTGDLSNWSCVFETFCDHLGPSSAQEVVGSLAEWVASVEQSTTRKVELGHDTSALCRDECLAVSIVAAAQSEPCPAMRACAFALLGNSHVDPMLDKAGDLAGELNAVGYRLDPAFAHDPQSISMVTPAGRS